MSSVDIRVDLPSYSRTFTVSVHSQSSVRQVKQEIQVKCPGQPRPEGQRLIWRGRILSDDENIESLWKSEPRIVHLAVHPSAWSSSPPDIPAPPTPQAPYTPAEENSYFSDFIRQPEHPILTFVIYQHQLALSSLSSSIPAPKAMVDPPLRRLIAKEELERHGWSWPAILDEDVPPVSEGGLLYETTTLDGQPYLKLLNPDQKPTPRQEHALQVLTFTFTILTMPLPHTPPVRNQTPQSVTVPPHVNQLLQQMGLPPLRVANNNDPQPMGNRRAGPLRDIPIRPLLAPLMLLLLRTLLLLYFVAPARKPIFGVLILAWMLYEIWQPIRNGLQNGWGANRENPAQAGDGAPAAGADPAQPNGGPQANQPLPDGLRQAPANPAPRPNLIPGALDQHANIIFDQLANINIPNEERVMNAPQGTQFAEPTFGFKAFSFVVLLISTLHPAVWNRRRVALRRREGVIRTEANMMRRPLPEAAEGDDNEAGTPSPAAAMAQVQEEMRTRFQRRPRWVQRYMERVVEEDWVDDSD